MVIIGSEKEHSQVGKTTYETREFLKSIELRIFRLFA